MLIAAALGAIAGLTLFFHGFSLLQQRWPSPTYRPAKPSPPTLTATQAESTSEPQNTAAARNEPRSSRAEVIKLTPQDSGELGSVSMTQQGRIAAALLKAGVPSPATWSNESVQVTVRMTEQSAKPSPAPDTEVSRVLQQGATASQFRIPALNTTAQCHASNWKATLMIWGGPALTLTCIYILAARLGWL